MSEIDFEFARRDDCLDRMVPSDLRRIVSERDQFRTRISELEAERLPEYARPIFDELERAVEKFPSWPTDPLHALGVVHEEVGELSKAVLQAVYEPEKQTPDAVRNEALQAAAMALRLVASLDQYRYQGSDQHQQALARTDTEDAIDE